MFASHPKINVEGISVTRALVELKTLEKRINKSIQDCDIIKLRKREDNWDLDKFNKDSRAAYQSVTDLIERRNLIKSKILHSNAVTSVKIGVKEYTINEAIDRKNSLTYTRDFYNKLKEQQITVKDQFERKSEEVKQKLDRLIEINFAKEKSNNSDISSISKAYYETNKIEIVDPINIDEKITKLSDEIVEFEKEVDLVLSESNAKTMLQL